MSQRLPGHEWAFGSASHMSRVGIAPPCVGRETGGKQGVPPEAEGGGSLYLLYLAGNSHCYFWPLCTP